ncbi:MAG TPA: DUF1800 domain-containing protein [Casimicrobiaceae bacterium]|jgi:uncharacterized protein (DUF1800 family)|nr:DUF1800 domain-containing protein [Casimicrobiaceae bacterium]
MSAWRRWWILAACAGCAACAGGAGSVPSGTEVASPTAGSRAATPVAVSRVDAPLGIDDARTLLTRTGFGATPAEIADYARLTRGAAVERLLAATTTRASTAPPPPIGSPESLERPRRGASDDDRKAFRRAQARDTMALRAWWLHEMLVTPSPLTERMTLFWHGHFATGVQKVRLATLMYRQNATLRANAVGNFGALLHAVARDPAMMIWLDTAQNRRGHPNENFAREAMELFTLGEGHYDERDVQEAARAFTGWSVDRDALTFTTRPRLHDDGVKTVLGRTGRLDGNDVLDTILAESRTATFITGELWREFVSPVPDEREVARIAAHFRESGYDIKAVLRDLFTSDAMFAETSRGALVKSPVDVVVGSLHTLGIVPDDMRPYALACAAMGQNLFAPPNVRGWPGGDAWINSGTLLARKQFLARLARADNFGIPAPPVGGMPMRAARETPFDVAHWLDPLPADAGRDARERSLRVLLPIAPVDAAAIAGDTSNVVRTALQDPAYELQ